MSEMVIHDVEGLRSMLDALLEHNEEATRWDDFYAQGREKATPIPFLANYPDENLVSYFESGMISAGRVLEVGCGPGRNAI